MSLHWILPLTLALTLLHCLTAHPIVTRDVKVYGHVTRLIDRLKKSNCKEYDSKFYSPSGSEQCIINALNCSIQELDNVRSECFAEKDNEKTQLISRTKDFISEILKNTNNALQTDHTNCFCGNKIPETKTYQEFLNNILRLLRMLNSS